MLTKSRLNHSIGVARKCYILAKELNKPEDFCRKMFFLGYIHDIGYEFGTNENHADICVDILQSLGVLDEVGSIKYHSKYPCIHTLEWKILSIADLTVDSEGNYVDVNVRLQDIKHRYGEHSNQYLTACDVAYMVGLTNYNLAGNIT